MVDDKPKIETNDRPSESTTAVDRLRDDATPERDSTRTQNSEKDQSKPESMPKESDSSKQTDSRFLHDNWKALVENNAKLTAKQKDELKSSFEVLEANGDKKISDFRKFIAEIGKISTAHGADTEARINAFAKLANTLANYPNAVDLPAERVLQARNIEALSQIADSFAQSAPHESAPPREVDGSLSKTGDGYEHAASRALQIALKDKAVMDKLIAEGKLPAGDWVFVPAAKGSTADSLKIDGMLVDMKSGKAVFIDFAMHQRGRTPYARLIDKLNTNDHKNLFKDGSLKHPWALTLDNESTGRNLDTGEISAKVDSTRVLERLGSYLKGTQPQDLGFTTVRQDPPFQYDLAKLKADLGGRFPNFAPVYGELEAAILTQERGEKVQTRQQELSEIAKYKNSSRPELRMFGFSAEAAARSSEELQMGTDFFNRGLRAAVEAEKYGALDKLYAGKSPDVKFSVGVDSSYSIPSKYAGQRFIAITGDDTTGSNGRSKAASEVRIYANGDVLVRPGGGTFQPIGNVQDLGQNIARQLQKDGIDPRAFKSQIKELFRLGKNFERIATDIQAINDGTMTGDRFWSNHPELKLLANGIGNGEATQRAAQERRPIYDARQKIDATADLSRLPDKTKEELAQRAVDLEKTGFKKLSLQNVRTVMQLESTGMETKQAVDAVRFQTALGKDAETWSANELKKAFENTKQVQSQDFPRTSELPDVFRMKQLQGELGVDAQTAQTLFKFKSMLPAASTADLVAVKQLYDSIKAAGIQSFNQESAANIFTKHGNLPKTVIDEMGRLSKTHKSNLKPEELASTAARNVQIEAQYGVDKITADKIRNAVSDLLTSGAPHGMVHDAAALMETRNVPKTEAIQLARTMSELRERQSFSSFQHLSDTASLVQSAGKLSESIRADFQNLLAEGIKKHQNDFSKLRSFLENEVFQRGTSGGAHEKDWARLFDGMGKNESELARFLGLPADAAKQKQALEAFQKLYETNQIPQTQQPREQMMSVALVEAKLQGNQTFVRLTDETRMTDALKQLTDRTLQRMPANPAEQGDFLSKQLKAAMRKQLGVATDSELPTALRTFRIKIVDSDSKSLKVVQTHPTDSASIEIPRKLISENPKGVLVDAYTNLTGLNIINMLKEKGSGEATMRSLEPMLNKIASQAEKIVGARSVALATQERPAITAEAASSDRKITLDPKKPLVTTWDGENLSFGGEHFHVNSEIEKLEKERETRVKDLEEQYKKASELAEQTKNAEDIARARALETQLAAERQSLKVVSELRQAMTGQRGQAAQEKARSLVKTAADRAIEERLTPKERGGGVPISRAAAMAMVVSSLAFMYFGANAPAQASSYEGSFR